MPNEQRPLLLCHRYLLSFPCFLYPVVTLHNEYNEWTMYVSVAVMLVERR